MASDDAFVMHAALCLRRVHEAEAALELARRELSMACGGLDAAQLEAYLTDTLEPQE